MNESWFVWLFGGDRAVANPSSGGASFSGVECHKSVASMKP